MQLGTGLYTGQRRPDDDRSMTEIYDELVALGRAADRAGLDSAWVSEHHFADDGYLSGTLPTLGGLATATDQIEIGSGVLLAPLYDPVRVAEDAATVSLLADGRLSMGLSIGYRQREFDGFGVPKAERVDRTVEAVEVLRGAWSDGPLGFDPAFHPADASYAVTPKPDDSPPIVLGGGAKPAVRRAARLGDGWMAPSSISFSGLEKRVDDIRAVREDEGLDREFTFYVLQHGFVGDSKAEAWTAMKDGYLYIQRKYAEWFGGEPIDELPADRVADLKEQAIFGTPEDIVEGLEPYREAVGDDVHVILRTYHPGIGRERMIECVERLGDEVAPAL
jgi:alkanesulfonate monooxygenase SsuD/methylene tetrahydromethanopterin reductase-like flavin-dependent oxidoreductase (luciferase family)